MIDFAARWDRLWKQRRLGGAPSKLFGLLDYEYSHVSRSYHTWEHIEHCLRIFDTLSHIAVKPLDVELALWMHDVYYVPGASDNETRSADAIRRYSDEVATLVSWTKHNNIPVDSDARLLVDIDCAILGADAGEFAVYEAGIREEWNHITDVQYADGRTAFMRRHFLNRPLIYFTLQMQDRFEVQARRNLAKYA